MSPAPFIRWPGPDLTRAEAGGKAAALAELAAAGLPVPGFFVLTPTAFEASLSGVQTGALATAASGAGETDVLEAAFAAIAPSDAVREALRDALNELAAREGVGADDVRVAVRSTAADEDGVAHSFAGQHESFLFVTPARAAERVADVWRSAFAPRALAYRRERGIAPVPVAPPVLVQRMVNADVAGVAFSADPVTGADDTAVVAAVAGLGSALVDGRADGETLRVDASGAVTERTPADQPHADRPRADGDGVEEVPFTSAGPVLTDADAARVAALARQCADHFGRPQDIEWAIEGGRLFLLQSRPITTLPAPPADPGGVLRLWDNANIAESYGGVTTPLTFAFARRAYAAVYRQFCRLMGVPEGRIAANDDMFDAMIGLHAGRVYYNLGSWYRLLALLPGYRANRAFMEGMMGVKEPIPENLRPPDPPGGVWSDRLDLLRSAFGLLGSHRRLPAMKRAFYARLDGALAEPAGGGLDALGLDALAAYYRRLDGTLLSQWDAPLVNDFFAMIFFGLADRLSGKWIGEGALGHLLTGEGGIISTEPARRVRTMAEGIPDSPALAQLLVEGEADAIARALPAHPALDAALTDYLATFGDRCLDELKLESATLADDPLPLYRAVGAMAQRFAREAVPPVGAVEQTLRRDAEARASAALRGHPLRRLVFGWVLKRARARVADRENLRFERTRVFGRARRIFLAMGERLAAAGRLDAARDVFWLEPGELLSAAEGTASAYGLRGLAAARRAEYDGYHAGPSPPDRFTTRGAVVLSVPTATATSAATSEASADGGEVRTGLGCCPGVVEGPARVVRDPRGVTLAPGTVLVAERTDPGWILLFPACAGLVVERGSLLSHAAIVARELGIPAVVSVPGATAWIADGDRVRLDGATGRVERLAPAAD